MRICSTMSFIDPLRPPRAALGFFEHLAERGHQIDLHAPTPSQVGQAQPQRSIPGVRFHGYRAALDWFWAGAGTPIGDLHELVDRADVVYMVGTWNYNHLVASRRAHRKGIPVVIAPHENLNPGALALKSHKKKVAWLAFQRDIINRASALHAMTETERERLESLTSSRVFVVPLGVDRPRSMARREPPSPRGPLRLLFLARIVPLKGLPRAFQMLRQLRRVGIDATLDVVGDGAEPYLAELRQLTSTLGIAPHVHWWGWLEGDRKSKVLESAHLLLLPSHFEGTSLAMIEALAHGVPTLRSSSSRLLGVGPEQGVHWVPDEDWTSPAGVKLVRSVIADYPDLSSRAVEYALRRHDWDRNSANLERELERVVEESRPRIPAGSLPVPPPGPAIAMASASLTGSARPRVSVLIPTRNRPESLRRCIESVLAQRLDDYELVVVDDASEPPVSQGSLAQFVKDPRIRVLRHERPMGVVAVRNRLMQEARGELLLSLDDDAYFGDAECAARVVEGFRSDPNIGIVSGRIADHTGPRTELMVPIAQRFRRRDRTLEERSRLVSYFVGGFHAIRKSFVEACGSYQADLVFGEEELDLSFRAVQGGYKILYLPDVLVHHVRQPSVFGNPTERASKQLYHRVRNRFYLAYRYLPAHAAIVFLPIWLTFLGLEAARSGFLRSYLRGVAAGIRGLSEWKRQPLQAQHTAYLKTHFGRLWY